MPPISLHTQPIHHLERVTVLPLLPPSAISGACLSLTIKGLNQDCHWPHDEGHFTLSTLFVSVKRKVPLSPVLIAQRSFTYTENAKPQLNRILVGTAFYIYPGDHKARHMCTTESCIDFKGQAIILNRGARASIPLKSMTSKFVEDQGLLFITAHLS